MFKMIRNTTPVAAILVLLVATMVSVDPPGARLSLGAGTRFSREATPDEALLARDLIGSDSSPGAYEAAAEHARALGAATLVEDPGLASAGWSFVGPSNIGGRILDLVVDPEQPSTLYAAAASGGVWVSRDFGRTFQPSWPPEETPAIGALAMTPSGVLFAGTGEAGPGGGSLTYGGNGVHRSTDRGKTWKHIGLEGSSRIGRIAVDPADEKRIFVAATGPLFTPGGERGLYRSTDGGDTWQRVLAGDNDTTGAVDVAVDPSNPHRVYAAMWDHLRSPDLRRYEGTGSGLYRSEDGGDTWTRIVGPFGPARTIGRIGVTVAPRADGAGPDDAETVYAVVAGAGGTHAAGGLYRSTDGGTTWAFLNHAFGCSVEAADCAGDGTDLYTWWFGRVWVDPADLDHLFVAGVVLTESRDGGVTWIANYSVHADQHAMAWHPRVAGLVYLGNDGGVYRSSDKGATWAFGESMPWSQLYTLDVGEQNPNRQVAGLQDNGSNRSYGDKDWNKYGGGDGLRVIIDYENQDVVYGCWQYGECFVTDDGGTDPARQHQFSDLIPSRAKNWFTPVELDPVDPKIVYTGGTHVWRSDDRARNWRPISPDLTNGPGRETHPLFRHYGTITTIAPAASETGTIYAGTDDGNLWYTHDGGTTWVEAADADLPAAWVSRVEVDRSNDDVAYVAYSGYRQGERASYLLRTRDGGASWENVGGALPKAPVNDVNIVDGSIVVATDVGVFASRDAGVRWLKVGASLPLVPVHELRWHGPTRTLYAATFGRGMWKVSLAALRADIGSDPRNQPRDPARTRPAPTRHLPATGLDGRPGLLVLAALAAVAARRRLIRA